MSAHPAVLVQNISAAWLRNAFAGSLAALVLVLLLIPGSVTCGPFRPVGRHAAGPHLKRPLRLWPRPRRIVGMPIFAGSALELRAYRRIGLKVCMGRGLAACPRTSIGVALWSASPYRD